MHTGVVPSNHHREMEGKAIQAALLAACKDQLENAAPEATKVQMKEIEKKAAAALDGMYASPRSGVRIDYDRNLRASRWRTLGAKQAQFRFQHILSREIKAGEQPLNQIESRSGFCLAELLDAND